MSRHPTIHPDPAAPPPPSSELDLGTLTIAAVASAAAAFVTSKVWPAGTLWSAAASPVIVALVKEGLKRPANRLQTVARDRGGRLTRGPDLTGATDTGPVRVYGRAGIRRRWKLAVATGLLAFAVVAFIYTVPELVAGRSIGGGGDKRTTFFGGTPSRKRDAREADRRAKETPAPGSTATPEPDASPSATPSASATASPTTTVTPEATASATASPAATASPTP
jgi:hypothetical protein